MKRTYIIYGWVTCDISVEIGTFETKLSLHDTWDMITQIFNDGTYTHGLYAKEVK